MSQTPRTYGTAFIVVTDNDGATTTWTAEAWQKDFDTQLKCLADSPDDMFAALVASVGIIDGETLLGAVRRFRTVDRDSPRAIGLLARLTIAAGRAKEAERLLVDLRHDHAQRATMLTLTAALARGSGDATRARDAIRMALEHDPEHREAMMLLVDIPDGALRATLTELAARPTAVLPLLELARLETAEGKPDAARAALAEALRRSDSSARLELAVASASRLGEVDLVIGAIDPNFVPTAESAALAVHFVRALIMRGDWRRAGTLLARLRIVSRDGEAFDDLESAIEVTAARDLANTQTTPERLVIHGPIWGRHVDGIDVELSAAASAPVVGVFAFALHGTSDALAMSQLGRASRSLPLYLSESIAVELVAKTTVIIPVVDHRAPVVATAAWPHDIVKTAFDDKPRFIVTGVLELADNDIKVTLSISGDTIATIEVAGASIAELGLAARMRLFEVLGAAGVARATGRDTVVPGDRLNDSYLDACAFTFTYLAHARAPADYPPFWNEAAVIAAYVDAIRTAPALSSKALLVTAAIAALRAQSPHASLALDEARAAVKADARFAHLHIP